MYTRNQGSLCQYLSILSFLCHHHIHIFLFSQSLPLSPLSSPSVLFLLKYPAGCSPIHSWLLKIHTPYCNQNDLSKHKSICNLPVPRLSSVSPYCSLASIHIDLFPPLRCHVPPAMEHFACYSFCLQCPFTLIHSLPD